MGEKRIIRIKSSDLMPYEKIGNSWKKINLELPNAFQVIKLFKAHGRFSELVDKKDSKFLKGQLFGKKCQGARINILPNGEKIDKAYSLFAEDLTIHDESSHNHWDVIYKNPNGKYAYVYTLKKKRKASKEKYNLVKEFEKNYNAIDRKAYSNIGKKSMMPLAIIVLLKTFMRVGNEMFYRLHKSKGLTTLKKSDVIISGNRVKFKYLSKGGVPIETECEFPNSFISEFRNRLKKLKNNDFIFVGANGEPLKDIDFEKTFKEYCGIGFYPHIVRSYYATHRVEDFFKKNKRPDKKELKEFLLDVSEKLGHKRFNKKNNCWQSSSTVTISHYINPKLVEKIEKFR
jgi:hypothetical protein